MRAARRTSAALMLVVGFMLLLVAPAYAHVTVSPEVFGPNEFGTFTFTVPNESDDEATIAIDVKLPEGFVLEDAQQIPGWTTVIDKGTNGVPVAVHWRGGSLAPGNFATFAIRGRTPNTKGSLAFPTVQRLEHSTESWTGAPNSEQPAPTVQLSAAAGAAGGTGAPVTPSVPLATEGSAGSVTTNQDGVDGLARSRSSLALTAAGTALIVGLVGLTLVLRRRSSSEATERVAASESPKQRPESTVQPIRQPARKPKKAR